MSDEGKYCLVPFMALLQQPIVDKIVHADPLETRISQYDLQVIRDVMLGVGMDRMGQAIARCISSTLDTLTELGLSNATSMVKSALQFVSLSYNVEVQSFCFSWMGNGKENVIRSDFQHAQTHELNPIFALEVAANLNCAFFKSQWPNRGGPISMMDILDADWKSSKESYYHHTRPTWQHTFRFANVESDPLAITTAIALARNLGVTHMSMVQLQALGRVFLCLRCEPDFRQVMDWKELVRGFVNIDIYARLTCRRSGTSLRLDKKLRKWRISCICACSVLHAILSQALICTITIRNEKYGSLFVFNHSFVDYPQEPIAMSLTNTTAITGNLVQLCSCAVCTQTPRAKGKKCKICDKACVIFTAPCVTTLKIHIAKRYAPLCSFYHACADMFLPPTSHLPLGSDFRSKKQGSFNASKIADYIGVPSLW